jgi:putative membrane-bound dehydrogenase-like protein
MTWIRRSPFVFLFLLLPLVPAVGQKQFGFDNRKASGQPYLTADESVKRMQVPPGWEVKVFAAEPDVINPIAFTVDERGRLWVVECFEYPKRTPKGQKPRDRVKILEDTDGDGKADKVIAWAEGKNLPISFDMASGIEVGHGGAFLGAPPYLFLLKDTKGAGVCDKQEILLKGFGSQDTHETLNTFQWGPDCKLYGLHGVFTHSEVDGVKMNGAVWRYDPSHLAPKGRGGEGKFEIFAEGTSNPWGMDFDARGQCHLACCVIPHLFHMVPGGTYKRQAGSSFNPYAYGLLNESCDHTHHKESGWAHAGLLVMQGDHVPKEYQDSLIMGSIHGCSIKRDVLRPNGSTFVASHAPDFLVSGDKNFRPINLRWGPDGSIYCIDWHDQNPCHQAPADSWDQKHGRIYKIQRKGQKNTPTPDLAKKTSRELAEMLTMDNPWWYRTALRLLHERKDQTVVPQLRDLMKNGRREVDRLRGLWGLFAVGACDEEVADLALQMPEASLRLWAIRLLGESGQVSDKTLARWTTLAKSEPAPEVRLQLASTAQRLTKLDTLPLLESLLKRNDAKDPFLPLMLWLAYEPRVSTQQSRVLDWLAKNAPGIPLITDEIVARTMRRLAVTQKADNLDACVAFLGAVQDSAVRRQALLGLTEGLKAVQVAMPKGWTAVQATLAQDPDKKVRELTQRLAVIFKSREAIARALDVMRDATKSIAERRDALRDLAQVHPPEALGALLDLVSREPSVELRCEACRTLAGYDSPDVPRRILPGWKKYPPALRNEAVSLLAGRKTWAQELLSAVGKKDVPRTDLTDNTILRIRAFKDSKLNLQIETVWGRFRDTPAELGALIDKMRGELHAGPASFERGRKVFDNQCAKCHKFDGKGHDVGPNLDGAARDIEYLLANVLDPNRVVGQPYYIRTVELKSGRIETGLLHAEDDQTITLKTENDVLKVIPRKEIEGKILVQEKSVMPEGLANNMTVQDFRDLIRYTMAHPFLTEVAVAGPFAGEEKVHIDNPLSSKTRMWNRPTVGAAGRIALPAAKKDAVAYIAVDVKSPEACRTRLQLGAAHTVTVWLNGKQIYKDKPGNAPATPDQAGIDVELRFGVNRLLFQIAYRGDNESVYARLLDAERRLIYSLEK